MVHKWVDRLALDWVGQVVLPVTTHYFDGKFRDSKVLTTVFKEITTQLHIYIRFIALSSVIADRYVKLLAEFLRCRVCFKNSSPFVHQVPEAACKLGCDRSSQYCLQRAAQSQLPLLKC